MHIYQKSILDALRASEMLRYSKLQPDGVESSHFKYHLNQLLRDGLVEQAGRGIYCLSEKGKAAVDLLSSGRVKPHTTPKVITYTLLRDSEHYYLFAKDKEPYRGLSNMIGGKVHVGESCEEAARREVHEKSGLELEGLELRAVAQVRIRSRELLLSHVIAYVYAAGMPDQKTNLTAVPLDTLAARNDLAPDLRPIIEALERNPEIQPLDIECIFAG